MGEIVSVGDTIMYSGESDCFSFVLGGDGVGCGIDMAIGACLFLSVVVERVRGVFGDACGDIAEGCCLWPASLDDPNPIAETTSNPNHTYDGIGWQYDCDV